MYIIASSLDEFESRLEITTGEAERHGCTWLISKFFAGRNVNILSSHQVTLNPSGKIPSQAGPDPSRVEKLVQMEPLKTKNKSVLP